MPETDVQEPMGVVTGSLREGRLGTRPRKEAGLKCTGIRKVSHYVAHTDFKLMQARLTCHELIILLPESPKC